MSALLLHQQAADYFAQGEYDRAIALYEQSIAENPQERSLYGYLGLALLLKGQEGEAQMTWLSAITDDSPEEAALWTTELTQILAAEAQHRESIADYQTAWVLRQYIHEFDPDNVLNVLLLANLAIELNSFDAEIESALVQVNQHLNLKTCNLTNQYLLLRILDRLIDLNPNHSLISTCLLAENSLANTETIYLKQKLIIAYDKKGSELYSQRNFQEAAHCYTQALKLEANISTNNQANLAYSLGLALMGKREFKQAEASFRQALEFDPSLEAINHQIYRVHYEAENAKKGYQFTQDWFSLNLQYWREYLQEFTNQPNIQFLEIGSWEGRSACWLLDYILTHESARITCIDTFEGSLEHHILYAGNYIQSVEGRFDFNIRATGHPEKAIKLVGMSQEVLRSLSYNTYDVIYIDGSHIASDVLEDGVLSWRLLKVGGLLIFDDYEFIYPDNPENNTQIGIDAFIKTFTPKIKVLHQGHQVILRKLAA